MKSIQTFSILIWASKNKSSNKDRSLYARLTVNGQRVEISLKKKVHDDRWDANASLVKGATEDARTVNNYINQVKSELFKIYTEMKMFNENITADEVKRKYLGEDKPRKTLLEVFDYHNDQMEKMVGIDCVQATLTKFKTVRDKISAFIEYQYKKKDMFLDDLNHQFVTNFEYYLKSHDKIQHNTTMKYIRNLKKVINEAVRNQWLVQSPFSNFKCSFKKTDRQSLTAEELQTLESKEISIPRMQQVRDLFVFSCYTGFAYIDVMQLTPNEISRGIDGEYWIVTSREKTNEAVHVPLLPKAMEIIEKYKNHPDVVKKGTLLPSYSNQKLNSYLKEIADICEIKKQLTFHIARYTFATTILLSNGVPIETVSKLLGHSSIKTTQIYAKILQVKVCQDMKTLKEKLNETNKNKKVQTMKTV